MTLIIVFLCILASVVPSFADNYTVTIVNSYINSTGRGSPILFGFTTISSEVLTLNSWATYYGCNTTVYHNGVPKEPVVRYTSDGFWQNWNYYMKFVQSCLVQFNYEADDFTYSIQNNIYYGQKQGLLSAKIASATVFIPNTIE